jgi:membrane fusion protein, multidrug efflux system
MILLHLVVLSLTLAFAQYSAEAVQRQVSAELVKVVSQRLEKKNSLPGELLPYQSVDIYPRVTGFIQSIQVDRGSWVKAGQLLATMSAPELQAQRAEAEARLQSVQAQQIEASAKLAVAESTYERLKAASATPGVVAGNDLLIAQKGVEAEKARVKSLESSAAAAQQSVRALQEIESYLRIEAPFDGVISERNAHIGSLVGPSTSAGKPLLRLEQISRLRLVVPVPETDAGSIVAGTRVSFTVPAHPGVEFHGVVRRPAYSVDTRTRSMPVELDVQNPVRKLSPGMYADVAWPVRRVTPSLFVPASAVVTTTERIFVIRVREGTAEWVDVRRGTASGDRVEVLGNLKEGDLVVRRGTDEIRPGTRIVTP